MHPEVEHVIEAVSMEKGISKELIWEAVEDSMLPAVRKQVGMQFNVEVKFNPKVKELEVFKVLRVVPVVNDAFTEITAEDARPLRHRRRASREARSSPRTRRRTGGQAELYAALA
jgi:transcription termination/antitermination protein NusA